MGGMKSIDIKSLLIGTLLASTIFLGVAATSPRVAATSPDGTVINWDNTQVWRVERRGWDEPKGHANRLTNMLQPVGFEPFAATDKNVFFRKRMR